MSQCAMDLFSLYVLFSHFRPRDVTPGNTFFQMSSSARAYVCITHVKTKRNSLGNITWSEMGKQNVQAKEVHLLSRRYGGFCSCDRQLHLPFFGALVKKGKERKGTLFKCLVVLALEHWLGKL